MGVLISVIIPVHNASANLEQCLDAVRRSGYANYECLVADDHSFDDSAVVAAKHGVRVLSTGGQCGPARARNLGAEAAAGDVLLFIDADVCIEESTLARVAEAFEHDETLDALIGSYDDDPAELNFLSQYKNLMHCFVHQHGCRRASTFWTGCGAIRRSVFIACGGFDEHYTRPSIEDIELGARLIRGGRKIELDAGLTVKHLKHWTFLELLESDIRDRAIPWTILMLRERNIPNDLNVQWSQRVSAVLVFLALALALVCWPASALALAITTALNHRFYGFLAWRRGFWFALRAIPLHWLYFVYSGAAFAAALPAGVFAKHRP
jgi:glycosyltransferase involved in cell wall biosynthesis